MPPCEVSPSACLAGVPRACHCPAGQEGGERAPCHWTGHEEQTPLSGPHTDKQGRASQVEPSRGRLMELRVGNHFVIKPLISEMSVKASVSAGQRFYVVRVLEGGDLSARTAGWARREGVGPRNSWGQWVPQSCRLEWTPNGSREDHPQRGHQQDGAKSRLGREAGGAEGQRGSPQCPHSPSPNPAAPSEVVQKTECRHPLSRPHGHWLWGQVAICTEAGLWPAPGVGAGF